MLNFSGKAKERSESLLSWRFFVSYIYALVDPLTHLVRYVGQTVRLETRFRAHCNGQDSCTREWIAELTQQKQKPLLCILETIEEKEWVPVPGEPLFEHEPSDPHGLRSPRHRETLWLKRFRKTILNRKTRDNDSASWDWLVNPDTPPSEEGPTLEDVLNGTSS